MARASQEHSSEQIYDMPFSIIARPLLPQDLDEAKVQSMMRDLQVRRSFAPSDINRTLPERIPFHPSMFSGYRENRIPTITITLALVAVIDTRRYGELRWRCADFVTAPKVKLANHTGSLSAQYAPECASIPRIFYTKLPVAMTTCMRIKFLFYFIRRCFKNYHSANRTR